jgi:hypothetical protein
MAMHPDARSMTIGEVHLAKCIAIAIDPPAVLAEFLEVIAIDNRSARNRSILVEQDYLIPTSRGSLGLFPEGH